MTKLHVNGDCEYGDAVDGGQPNDDSDNNEDQIVHGHDHEENDNHDRNDMAMSAMEHSMAITITGQIHMV